MSTFRFRVVTALLLAIPFALDAQSIPPWRVFQSRAGWSISKPSTWVPWSCRNCPDPTAADLDYVFFGPRQHADSGLVAVWVLKGKPASRSPDEWLREVARTFDLNPIVMEARTTHSGLPALQVRVRQADGTLAEDVYVVAAERTYLIGFSSELPNTPLEDLPNYATYLKMLQSFRVEPPRLDRQTRSPHGTNGV